MNATAKVFARATKGNKHHFYSQRNALTMFLAFLFIMAVACFSNYVQARKQRGCLRLINCYIGRFLWALPKPAIFEKIE
ncbi:hypothetical protein [Ruminococcus sp.]|uniref:hypothetical protein n=1 Tax=Ruminococcus sp. TaxID=41978 RepID=UPI003AB166CA